MADVFISYKREEREKVLLIADRLRAYGLDVWFDARLTTGHHFDQEIDQHVRTAKCVLVCWSSAALTSEWVRAEAAIGRERGVIVPLMIEPCSPPVPFNTMQTEDLSRWAGEGDHEGWTRAIERVGQLVGRGDLVAAEQARGAQELETKRIQAMLDAQRREEEQARRSADAAAAETARLEAELKSRGVTAASVAPRSAAAKPAKPAKTKTPKPPRAPGEKKGGLIFRLIGAVLLAAIIAGGAGAGGYYVGHESGYDDGRSSGLYSGEQRARSTVRQQAIEAISGDWCFVEGAWSDVSVRYEHGEFQFKQRVRRDWNTIDSPTLSPFGLTYRRFNNNEAFVRVGDNLIWYTSAKYSLYRRCTTTTTTP